MAVAQRPIHAVAHEAMQRTANLTGDDSTPLFDEAAVKVAIRREGERIVAGLSQSLRAELALVRTEIVSRTYNDQTYGSDAEINAYSCRTSFELDADTVSPALRLPPVEPSWVVPVPVDVMEVGRKVSDWVARQTGWFDERTTVEKQRDKRQPLLDECVRVLEAVADEYRKRLMQAAEAAVTQATQALCQEVQRCFNQAFASEQAAQKNVVRWREQANAMRMPPPLLYGVTCILRARDGHVDLASP